MKKNTALIIFVLLAFVFSASAQTSRYIIKLKNKGGTTGSIANPSAYLSARAIARRVRYGIAVDSADLPVSKSYLDSIRSSGNVIILNTSKWLNQVAIKTTDAAALIKISKFSFVQGTSAVGATTNGPIVAVEKNLDAKAVEQEKINDVPLNYGQSNAQVKIHRTDWLHERGFKGQGMQLTILDAGFYHVNTLSSFDSARKNNQLLGTWDFVANEPSVDEDDTHGMKCLSTIAANIPGSFVGTAPKVSFYMFRTEDVASEYQIEEQNLVAGLERADSVGTDLVSISLGYNKFDNPATSYSYSQMNGNETISSRGADVAASKGILCVVANGNEGDNSWHYLLTPADADSVLSVGAVNVAGQPAGFSSYGPSSDGQIKPGVAAIGLGATVSNNFNGLPEFGNGTSYACPIMAGLSTCLWQAFPEVNNMSIINTLQQSGTRAANPDDRVGYGIPDAKKAFVLLEKKLFTKSATIDKYYTSVRINAKTTDDIQIDLLRKTAGQNAYSLLTTWQGSGAFAARDYTFLDDLRRENIGDVWYKFMMRITGDTSFVLDSVKVNFAAPSENSIKIGPIPVVNNLNIVLERSEQSKLLVTLHNAAGQKLYSSEFNQAPGYNTVEVPMGRLPKGIYFVRVFAKNKVLITKTIVK